MEGHVAVTCRITLNQDAKNRQKIRHLGTIAQLCRAISSQLRHVSTIGKNIVRPSNTFSTHSHNMVNFSPLPTEIGSLVWGTPANFNMFRVLAALLHRRRWLIANQTLHDVWPSPLLDATLYTFSVALAPDGFYQVQNSLRPSLAFSYIGSVTARHSSSGRQPNFAAWYREWNYRAFAEGATYILLGGHHVGHRPTF